MSWNVADAVSQHYCIYTVQHMHYRKEKLNICLNYSFVLCSVSYYFTNEKNLPVENIITADIQTRLHFKILDDCFA